MVFKNQYTVLGVIGEGSFSQVYKVENKYTGRKLAEKRLKRIFNSKTDLSECVELQILLKLPYHPNIVEVLDIICDPLPGYVHLVFELMDMNLIDFIKSQKKYLKEKKVQNILYQIVCGVAHLHKNHLFHRDLKPENVLLKISPHTKLNSFEIVKLADLGSACYLKRHEHLYTAYIATRWYRPPELILTTGNYDHKMDIWAIGCIFYELITFKPLFPGDNDLDQLYKIHEVIGSPNARLLEKFKNKVFDGQFPLRKSCLPNLLPNLCNFGQDLIQGCLTYDPVNRYQINQLKYHRYFNSIKNIELAFSSNLSQVSLTMRGNSLKNKIEKDNNNYKSKTTISLDYHSSNLKKISVKERERAWGMNAGPAKDLLLRKNRFKV